METGAIARQADGAVIVDMAETVVLVTAVGRKAADPGRDFFPLTVNYQEKTYAAGKIPGPGTLEHLHQALLHVNSPPRCV